MTLLTAQEKAEAVAEVGRLIRSSGQTAWVQRVSPGERLYGTEDESFVDLTEIPIEVTETPPEDLGKNIDAVCSVLPDADIFTEDRLVISGETYRIQSVEDEHFFGTTTHKSLKLVKIHGR